MQQNKSQYHTFAVLLMLLFIDGMSMGIIYPIMTPLLLSPESGILHVSMSVNLKDIFYAITISTFSFFTVIGAPILGDLSDKWGRKNTLIISMVGAGCAYILGSVAVIFKSITLLIISRALAGLTFGSQPVAQAVIVDISSPARKAANLSLVLLAICLGVTLGPVIGAALADKHLISWFTIKTPLYTAGILSFLNAILLWLFFYEKPVLNKKTKVRLFRGMELFIEAFKNKQVRWLSLCFLLMQLGWGCYVLFTPLFLTQEYQFTPLKVSVFYFLMGVGLSLGFALLTGKLTQKYSIKILTAIGLAVIGLGILVTGFVLNPLATWMMVVPASMADALAYTTFITLFSNAVGKEHQGWVMGVATAIWGIAWGTTGVLSGFLATNKVALPLQIGSFLVLISVLLILLYKEKIIKD